MSRGVTEAEAAAYVWDRVEVRRDQWEALRAALPPHAHTDGQNECAECDESLVVAVTRTLQEAKDVLAALAEGENCWCWPRHNGVHSEVCKRARAVLAKPVEPRS